MNSDIEELLRESLEVRAQDVRPDPETWNRVQTRVRRQRTFRLGLAGLSAAAAVLVAVAVVPGLMERPSVTFDPGPATDPGPVIPGDPEPPVPGPTVGCGSPADTAAVHTHQENVWAMCVNGAVVSLHESDGTALNPAVTVPGVGVLFEVWRDELPNIMYTGVAEGQAEVVVAGGELPAFSPQGRLAYVLQSDGQGSRIMVGWPDDVPHLEIPVDGRVRRLAWDTQDDRLWFESEGRVWTATLDGDFTAVQEHESEAGPQTYFSPAVAPDGTIAVLNDTNDGTLVLGYLDRAVVAGGEPRFTLVANLTENLRPGAEGLYLAPAGYVWVEPASDVALRWVPADRPAWVVGGDDDVWLVNEEGEMVHLQGGTQALAVNPGADLGPREDQDVIELDPQTGLPHNVEVTRQRIYSAARTGDFGGLHALMAPDFSWSFGGNLDRDEAIEHLRANPELLDVIAELLEGPHGEDGGMYSWPREFTESDEYLDHRLGIDADGVWRYFIAGD